MGRNGVILATNLGDYFEGEVKDTARKQGLSVSPFASSYLAKMLTRFADARSYLAQRHSDEDKKTQEIPTLALLWLEGFSKTVVEQLNQYQYLGDVALFTSGYFGERLDRSLVDMDYYMAMGGRAYERAGKLRESIQAERTVNVFFELSGQFQGFVEVVAEISDRTLLANDKDLLKLYEKWCRTDSERIRRMLAENGVIAQKGGTEAAPGLLIPNSGQGPDECPS